jgi:hypothetical protein
MPISRQQQIVCQQHQLLWEPRGKRISLTWEDFSLRFSSLIMQVQLLGEKNPLRLLGSANLRVQSNPIRRTRGSFDPWEQILMIFDFEFSFLFLKFKCQFVDKLRFCFSRRNTYGSYQSLPWSTSREL